MGCFSKAFEQGEQRHFHRNNGRCKAVGACPCILNTRWGNSIISLQHTRVLSTFTSSRSSMMKRGVLRVVHNADPNKA